MGSRTGWTIDDELIERIDRGWHAAKADGSSLSKSEWVSQLIEVGLRFTPELKTDAPQSDDAQTP